MLYFLRARNQYPGARQLDSFVISSFLPLSTLQTSEPLRPILDLLQGTLLNSNQTLLYVLDFVPAVLQAYVNLITKHRYHVFVQPSSSTFAYDVFVSDKVRAAIRLGLVQILDLLTTVPIADNGLAVWKCRNELWGVIAAWGGYLETESAWSGLLDEEARRSEQALVASAGSATDSTQLEILRLLVRTLTTLETLDHDHARIGTAVMGWCLAVSYHYEPVRRQLI